MHNYANALRNNAGIEQCFGVPENGGRMCVMGLAGFRAGIPKDELNERGSMALLEPYGFTNEESATILGNLELTGSKGYKYKIPISMSTLFSLNDAGRMSFDQVADWIDGKSSNL